VTVVDISDEIVDKAKEKVEAGLRRRVGKKRFVTC